MAYEFYLWLTLRGDEITIYSTRLGREIGTILFVANEPPPALHRRVLKEVAPYDIPDDVMLEIDEDTVAFHRLRSQILEFDAVRERIKHELGIAEE